MIRSKVATEPRILEQAIATKEAEGDVAGAAFLRTISPIAWHHINMYGTFTFHDEPLPPPLMACVAAIVRYRQYESSTEVDEGE